MIIHNASQFDVPLTDMVDLLVALKAGGHPLIGITARPDKWRALTMEWLIKFNLAWLLDELLMRPDDGFRPSSRNEDGAGSCPLQGHQGGSLDDYR